MKFVLLLLICAAPAWADTNLFSDGTWLIDGATDPGTNASGINIVIDKVPNGSFTELKFYYSATGSNFAQVFSIKGNGTWQGALPAPGMPGGVFRLASYWDCDQGFVGPLAVTELGWRSKPTRKGELQLTGKMANHNSLAADKLEVTFAPAESNNVQVELDYDLKATRDFCVDESRLTTQDVFRAVSMFSNFVSAEQHKNDQARFTWVAEKHCFGIYGCYTRREAICIPLTNAPPGYLVRTPRRLGGARAALVHSTEAPGNTPTLAVAHYKPSGSRVKMQGFYTPTDDPSMENVEYWSNWFQIKPEYRAGKRVGKFRIGLEVSPAKPLKCDELQNPNPTP